MPAVNFKGCYINVDDVNPRGKVLDPCNCSSYYVTNQVATGAESERKLCPGDNFWHFRNRRCESRQTVLDQKACDPALPWNRCLSPSDDRKIQHKCIVEGLFTPSSEGRSAADEMATLADLEKANMEMVLAAFVAGVVITLFLIAMLIAFCGLARLRLPIKVKELLNTNITIGTCSTRSGSSSTTSKRGYTTPSTHVTHVEHYTTDDYEDVDNEHVHRKHQQKNKTVTTSRDQGAKREVVVTKKTTTHVTHVQNRPMPVPASPSSRPGVTSTGFRSQQSSSGTSALRVPVKPPPKRIK